MITSGSILLTVVEWYKYLFEQRRELSKSVHTHDIQTKISVTVQLDKYGDEECDPFSTCKGQHTNANSSAGYCHDKRRCGDAP